MKTISKGGAVLFAVVVSGVCIFWCTGQASIGSAASATAQQVRDDPSPLGCSLQTVMGSYGISTTGWIVSAGPVGPVADVGVITLDGNGGASQTTTVSLNGVIISKRTSLSGSHEVNSDCTGSITLTLPGPGGPITSTSHMVIVNHGKELRAINTGAGRVLAGTAERQ